MSPDVQDVGGAIQAIYSLESAIAMVRDIDCDEEVRSEDLVTTEERLVRILHDREQELKQLIQDCRT